MNVIDIYRITNLMKIIDINSMGIYPANVLSNLHKKPFIMDGMFFGSIEGFLQGLREQNQNAQIEIFAKDGIDAKRTGRKIPLKNQTMYYRGQPFSRHSEYYKTLFYRAFVTCFAQNEKFQLALAETVNCRLEHSIGKNDPFDTILTNDEFIGVLTYIQFKFPKTLSEVLLKQKSV